MDMLIFHRRHPAHLSSCQLTFESYLLRDGRAGTESRFLPKLQLFRQHFGRQWKKIKLGKKLGGCSEWESSKVEFILVCILLWDRMEVNQM